MANHTHSFLEPQPQQYIDDLHAKGGEPFSILRPEAARDVWAGAQAVPVAKLLACIEDISVPAGSAIVYQRGRRR